MRRMQRLCLVMILLIPLGYFLPNIWTGGVLLPLDLLNYFEPFAQSAPSELARVHNPHLSDLIVLYYPCAELFRSAARLISLWNPYSFCGSPSLANAQNGLLYPFSWLLRLLPLGPAYLFIAIAKMWFCGLFAFLFYRAVRLPAGVHVVEFDYEPASFRIGLLLAILSGSAILLFIFLGRRH